MPRRKSHRWTLKIGKYTIRIGNSGTKKTQRSARRRKRKRKR